MVIESAFTALLPKNPPASPTAQSVSPITNPTAAPKPDRSTPAEGQQPSSLHLHWVKFSNHVA